MQESTWYLLFISIGLGLLVGLERQSSDSKTAGIRTFPMVTVMGTVCGMLGQVYGGWVIAAGFLSVTAILVISNIHRMRMKDESPGMTTEIAVLLMYAIGVYLVQKNYPVAVVVTGVLVVLLHFKSTIHGWVDRIGQKDLVGIVQFILISMVILPILPDQAYDKYESLNPKETWWMVVLIVGISLVGYFLYKIFGGKAGVLLGGILGGLISSTATTLSYAKRAAGGGGAIKLAAFVILTASAVSMIRVLVEVSVVAPGSFKQIAIPLAAELALMIFLVVLLFFRHRKEKNEMPEQGNPAQLKSAITFALLYAAVRFITSAVQEEFGDEALYVVSVVSGLTDMDAITLSTARMAESEEISDSMAWKLILIATMSNLVFKGGMAAVIGGRALGKIVGLLFGILIAAGFIILFAWPS